jgi:hypothetical protein
MEKVFPISTFGVKSPRLTHSRYLCLIILAKRELNPSSKGVLKQSVKRIDILEQFAVFESN